jgi:hypothetical protein
MMPLYWDTWMNLVFDTQEFSLLLSKLTVKSFADVILSMPFIQIRCFRAVNTLYFTAVGWMVFYIVWKWSIKAPIIAGKKKKKRSVPLLDSREMEAMLEFTFNNIVSNLEKESSKKNKKYD